MLGKPNKKKQTKMKLDTMIGPNTEIHGDVKFTQLLVIDGKVNGNVSAEDGSGSRLALNSGGRIVGDVSVPDLYIDGEVEGDVYATEHVELANNAQIKGNVYYNLLEMAMGASINGNLVHKPKGEIRLLEHKAAGNQKTEAKKDPKKNEQADTKQAKA